MSDNLRTRIAAAIQGVDDWRGVTDPAILADAVIRELDPQCPPKGKDDDELRSRILLAVLDSLKEGDPVLVIGVGDGELRISHE